MINADSAQVYADLAVLSARPSAEEMQGIEHRLFGAWDGAQACSAADWAAAAQARDRRRPCARAACRSWSAAPGSISARCSTASRRCRRSIRRCARQCAPCRSPRPMPRLPREDPARAAALAPADTARIARALEVVRSTGRTLADWQAASAAAASATTSTLHPLILLPDRALALRALRPALCRDAGAAARSTKSRPCSRASSIPPCPSCARSACREIAGYLRGEWSLDEAHRARRAGDAQLCQAAIYLVPPPAAGRLAANRVTSMSISQRYLKFYYNN